MKELFSFTGLLLWLWLFPMNGVLLSESGIVNGVNYFLTAHSLTLISFLWLRKELIDKYTPFLITATSLFSISFPYFKDYFFILLFLTGIISVLFAAMCLEILSGSFLSLYLSRYYSFIVLFGNITLIASATVLLFTEKRQKRWLSEKAEPVKQQIPTATSETPPDPQLDRLSKKLSPKEYEVFLHILKGKTYREISDIMKISESTVKTYMKRIFEKEMVSDKKSLLGKIMTNDENR